MARKQHKFHYIYKTTCTVTGKYYVGMRSTSNLEDDYIGSGKRLWLSIRKHGRENHQKEILEFLPDRRSLKEREQELVNDYMLQDPMCMNLMKGGHGGSQEKETQKKWWASGQDALKRLRENEEFRKKISKWNSETALKNWQRESYVNKMKDILANNFRGKRHSESFKKRMSSLMSEKQTGNKNSQYGTIWITNGKENRKIKKEETIPNGWSKGRILN